MRIGLDGTPLAEATGGIRRYTAELSRALQAECEQDQILLLSDQPIRAPAGIRVAERRPALGGRWWLLGLGREILRHRLDVFHGTDFAVPYVPVCPAVMTVHDLSPWREPSWHSGAKRVRRRTPVLLGLGLATMIVTPTEAIRREVLGHFRLAASRVVAVPLAAGEEFHPAPSPARKRPYFLYVGVLEPRKNLQTLVESWRQVRRQKLVDLVLAGRRRSDFNQLPPEPGLAILGEVPDAALPALYSGARAVLYPSFYEGFGLPVLEAMSCGAPLVVSRDPAIREVAGDAAIRVRATDGAGWMAAMRAVLEGDELCAELSTASLTRSRQFSWRRTAVQTREVYEEARKRFGR